MSEGTKTDLNNEPTCIASVSGPDIIVGPSLKIEVRKSSIHGYGVFAKEDITEGELIEQVKLLRLAWRANYTNDPVLRDYIWGDKSCKCKDCEMHGFPQYIALGFGSLYNHSVTPNTTQQLDFATEIMTIKAGRRIEKDEELFVNYGHKYWLVRDFWKQVHKSRTLEDFANKNKEAP
jgi:SET domain-containing protein